MEAITLLTIIKDDIAHLEQITSEFTTGSLPASAEVQLAIVRTNALQRQLELLLKITEKNEISPVASFPKNDEQEEIQADESIPPELAEIANVQAEETETIEKTETPPSSPEEEPVAAEPLKTEADDSHQLVNDILSQKKSESGYQIIPINSIWDGIGINDRFLFIRELFENSSAKFETTVTDLDHLATIQDAVNYLKMNFKWTKTEASERFLVLVKRRFTK
ncbi:MAG: hypothetical protein WCL21_07680 [Mariniphaga sp.]